jgi:PAS domain S-box-containing protein
MDQNDISEPSINNPDLAARRFQWLFHNSPNILTVISSDGIITTISDSSQKILGYNREEIIGKSLYDIVYEEDTEKVRQMLEAREGKPELSEFQVLCKDGSRRFLEAATSDPFSEGDLRGFLVTARDITKRKELERQLLRAQRMETIGSLAGGVAHDLNNILAPVLLALGVFRQGIRDKQKLKMLEVMESSINKGRNIVKQVLTFARGVEDQQTLVQLRHLVNDVLDIVTQTFPPNIHVEQNLSKDTWMVPADPTQLHQIFMNLFVNARDAMPNGGNITIDAKNLTFDEAYAQMVPNTHPGTYVALKISDTGTGIQAKYLRHIFDPFFTTKEKGKGTGLGLAMVKQIVENHNGAISVESKVGGGTTFHIYLPATQAVESDSEKKPLIEPPSGNGEFVIIADDDESILDITKQTLETFGYRVRTAVDGAEALALLIEEKARVRILLTDYAMPIMDGRQLIKAVKKMGFKIRIAVASGTSMPEEAKDEIKKDVDAILSKPFTARTLLTTFHDMLHPELNNAHGNGDLP